MAQSRLNEFSSFDFTEEEIKIAIMFSDLNVMFIQNERAKIAGQKLNHVLDPQNPDQYSLDIAHMQGQLDFAAWILQTALPPKQDEEVATNPDSIKP